MTSFPDGHDHLHPRPGHHFVRRRLLLQEERPARQRGQPQSEGQDRKLPGPGPEFSRFGEGLLLSAFRDPIFELEVGRVEEHPGGHPPERDGHHQRGPRHQLCVQASLKFFLGAMAT